MPQPSFSYTIVTETGDQNVKTKDSYQDFATIEQWLREQMPFQVAFKPGDKGTIVKEVYEGSNRSGKKIL